MKWEEFVEQRNKFVYRNAERTSIQCPKCGEDIWRRTDIVLACYPPQYQYFCKCGWSGTA